MKVFFPSNLDDYFCSHLLLSNLKIQLLAFLLSFDCCNEIRRDVMCDETWCLIRVFKKIQIWINFCMINFAKATRK